MGGGEGGERFQSNISYIHVVYEKISGGRRSFPGLPDFRDRLPCRLRGKHIREFKLRVSGNGKQQIRTFFAKFSLKRFRFIFSFLCRKNSHALQF